MTRFSVVTAVRNGMPNVVHAIASLESQSFDDFEHVVVDACSSDGTSEVVRASQPAIHIVEPDSGIYDAINKGIAHSSGDIVALLHADDRFNAGSVLGDVSNRFSYPDNPDMVLTDVIFVDENDRATRRYRSGRFRPSRLRWGWMPAHTGLFVRRAVYDQVGLYRTNYTIGADFEWVIRAFTEREFGFAYLPIISVRMLEGGASTAGIRSTITLNREVMRACREHGIATSYFHVLSKYPAKLFDKYRRG